jgi:NAD(P)-dependent dehydrogenase (short-subunit alcohol dehydrogenase family)
LRSLLVSPVIRSILTVQKNIETLALVSGATGGIGFEVCRQLAKNGITVILTGRDSEKAIAAADKLVGEGLDVVPKTLNVADEENVRKLANEIEQEYGRLDILFNNAAAFADWSETASSSDLNATRAVFETNLFGSWRTAQLFLPLLRRSQHPRIVNVSSGGGSHGDMQFGLTTNGGTSASYGISKAALNALTTKLAVELNGTGILVNAVCPGFTATAPGMEAMGARPISEGAASVAWAALLPDDGPTGGFFRDGKPLPW